MANDKNQNVRRQAAYALAQTGEVGGTAPVKAYTDSKNSQARTQILQAMLNTQVRAQAAPLLKQAIKDPDRDLRRFAVQMLPNLGRRRNASTCWPRR